MTDEAVETPSQPTKEEIDKLLEAAPGMGLSSFFRATTESNRHTPVRRSDNPHEPASFLSAKLVESRTHRKITHLADNFTPDADLSDNSRDIGHNTSPPLMASNCILKSGTTISGYWRTQSAWEAAAHAR
jgi:hypothetical protein